jgi:DNA-binding phage protein
MIKEFHTVAVSSIDRRNKPFINKLHKLVDEIFDMAKDEHDWTWTQLARNAGVSYLSVKNLGERHTKYPLFRTVHRLAHAVGLNITLQQQVVVQTRIRKAG